MCPRDKSGALVYLSYGGVVGITPELGLVLGGSPDAKTTSFGDSCKCSLALHPSPSLLLAPSIGVSLFPVPTHDLIIRLVIEMKFETGDEKLKGLETGVFVGAGRFIVEKGKPVVVEYKLSKAVKGN